MQISGVKRITGEVTMLVPPTELEDYAHYLGEIEEQNEYGALLVAEELNDTRFRRYLNRLKYDWIGYARHWCVLTRDVSGYEKGQEVTVDVEPTYLLDSDIGTPVILSGEYEYSTTKGEQRQ